MKAAVLLCAAVAIAAAPTLSQADRHDGAIRALLDDMLLSIQASGAGRGALLSEGPPHNTGAPGGGGYRVDFSGVRIAASAESIVDIGDMRLAIEALDGGRHGIAVHLATSFEVVDAAGRLRSTIKTGAQTLGAIWNPDILGFEAATARVEDIRQVDPSGDFIWRATRAEAGSVSERDPTGRWLQRSNAAFGRLEIVRPEGTLTRADRFEASLETNDLQLEAVAQMIRAAAEDLDREGDGFTLEIGRRMKARPELLPGGARAKVRIVGLTSTVIFPAALSLDVLDASVDIDTLAAPIGTVRIVLDLQGLEVPPSLTGLLGDVDVTAGLIPQSVAFRATVFNLPIQDIRTTYLAGTALPGDPHGNTNVFIIPRGVGAALDVARSSLQIEEFRIESAFLSLSGDGTIAVDPAAVAGVGGQADITVRGLDKYQGHLLRSPGGTSLRVLAIVGVLRALGEPIGPDGEDVRAYEIEMTRTGEVLVNGQDLAPILFPQ